MGNLGFDFGFFVSEICLFVFIHDAIFCGTTFSFSRTVCGYLRNLDVFIVIPFINSTGLAIVAEANLHCGNFLSEKIVTNW